MEPVMISILTGLVVTLIGGAILAYLRRRWKNADIDEIRESEREDEQSKIIRSMQRSIWRLNKTALITAKIIDEQTNKNHPELTSSLEDIATELLKESDKG